MKDFSGSIKLVLLFLILAALIAIVFLLAPDTLHVPGPNEIFPK